MTPGAIKFESEAIKIFDLALRIKINSQDTLHWYRLLELLKVTSNEVSNLENLVTKVHLGMNKQILQLS